MSGVLIKSTHLSKANNHFLYILYLFLQLLVYFKQTINFPNICVTPDKQAHEIIIYFHEKKVEMPP